MIDRQACEDLTADVMRYLMERNPDPSGIDADTVVNALLIVLVEAIGGAPTEQKRAHMLAASVFFLRKYANVSPTAFFEAVAALTADDDFPFEIEGSA